MTDQTNEGNTDISLITAFGLTGPSLTKFVLANSEQLSVFNLTCPTFQVILQLRVCTFFGANPAWNLAVVRRWTLDFGARWSSFPIPTSKSLYSSSIIEQKNVHTRYHWVYYKRKKKTEDKTFANRWRIKYPCIILISRSYLGFYSHYVTDEYGSHALAVVQCVKS